MALEVVAPRSTDDAEESQPKIPGRKEKGRKKAERQGPAQIYRSSQGELRFSLEPTQVAIAKRHPPPPQDAPVRTRAQLASAELLWSASRGSPLWRVVELFAVDLFFF